MSSVRNISQSNRKRKRYQSEPSFGDESKDVTHITETQNSQLELNNISASNILIINLQQNSYYCCVYQSETQKLLFLEEIRYIKNDTRFAETLLQQFHPDILICSNKTKVCLLLDKIDIGDTKLEVKPSKEFNIAEGELFFDSLERGLSRVESSSIAENALKFISRLRCKNSFPNYLSLISVFSINFEIHCAQNSRLKKTDLIKFMEFISMQGYLSIDRNSMIALRLSSEKHNVMGLTVSQMFGKCNTKIGNALLSQYLMRPLIDLDDILARHRAVGQFLEEIKFGKKNSVVSQIIDYLAGIADIHTIIQKLKMGNYEASIWKQLQSIFYNFDKLKELIECTPTLKAIDCCIKFIDSFEIHNLRKLQDILLETIDFSTDLDNLCIQKNFDTTLQRYKDLYDEMEQILSEKAFELKGLTGLDLVIAYIPQFGYLVAVERNSTTFDLLQSFDLVFTTSTTYYYKDQSMLDMDSNYGDLYSLIRDKEVEILFKLQASLFEQGLENLIVSYQYIGEIDVLLRFALVSYDNNFNKPELIEEETGIIDLKESFHPLFRTSKFISNDFKVLNSKVVVITGPNFSGKSTLLAQIGITIYLAQIGCFIPAKIGKLSIFKKILTRINTEESININQSTFMKDCQQMSECIVKSTVDSLVLIDEFGKGTDINDGPGLLGSSVKYFLNQGNNCPVVILSTHMIELFNKEIIGEVMDNIDFKQMEILFEKNNKFSMTFLYQLSSGIASSSAGLYCARRSGIDLAIIERAEFILQLLNQGQNIIGEFSLLDENEIKLIGEHKSKIKKFLELNFQEWPLEDHSKLKTELLKILHS